jgi:hypothetical protein
MLQIPVFSVAVVLTVQFITLLVLNFSLNAVHFMAAKLAKQKSQKDITYLPDS